MSRLIRKEVQMPSTGVGHRHTQKKARLNRENAARHLRKVTFSNLKQTLGGDDADRGANQTAIAGERA